MSLSSISFPFFSSSICYLDFSVYSIYVGFPGGSDGEEFASMQETWVQPLGQKDPLEKGMATQYNILAWTIP